MRIPLRRRKALTTVPSQPSFGKRFLGILAHQGDHGLNERHQAEEHREQEGRADNPPVSRGSQQGSRQIKRGMELPDNGRRRQARAGRRCRSRGHRDNPHLDHEAQSNLKAANSHRPQQAELAHTTRHERREPPRQRQSRQKHNGRQKRKGH